MKFIEEAEAQARLDEILDETQQQPIVIRRQGRDVAAIVSARDYERLRALNVQSFLGLREEAAREAATNGLTTTTPYSTSTHARGRRPLSSRKRR